MNVALAFARLFTHPEAKEVLDYLKHRTQERVLAPDASDSELRFLEGQRSMVALIVSLIQQGQQYALPGDCIRVLSAGGLERGYGLNYRIAEKEVHTNNPSVMLTYIYRPNEADFPPFFVQALVSKLAAEFCLPLTESTNRTDYLRKLAEEDIKSARLIDSQQAVPSSFQDFSLIEVRQ